MTHAFVTGATGLIGRWLVPELTRRGEVTVLLRRAGERSSAYRDWVIAHGGQADALAFVDGDLAAPGLGLSEIDCSRALTATEIYAGGALMQFEMNEDVARKTNVDGMATLIDIALAAGVRRFIHVGGYKLGELASFREHGVADDAAYDPALYAPLYRRLGAYEASKMQADHLVRDAARARHLPLVSIHPGGVIGDSRTGETTQFVGFAPLVEALYNGKLPAVPGGARHWLPLVSVDFLAKLIVHAAAADDSVGRSYTVLDDRTPMLFDLVSMIAEHIGAVAPRRRIPIGLLQTLLRAKLVPGQGSSGEELTFISNRRHDVHATTDLAARVGLAWPDLPSAVARCVDYLIASRFGTSTARHGASLDRVGGSRTFVYGERRAPDRVMLHGLPLDADSWDAVDALLPGSSLRADLPGLGRSARAAAPPADWLSSLLAGTSKPSLLVAHSLGTLYAVEYAHAYPDRVSGLVLVSPFFVQSKPPVVMRTRPLARGVGRLMQRGHLEQLVTGDARARTPVLDGPAADLRRPGAKARFGDALATAHARRETLTAKLVDIAARMPVLIIHGTRDPLVCQPPATRIVAIPGTGHFPQLDAPDVVARLIGELAATSPVRQAA